MRTPSIVLALVVCPVAFLLTSCGQGQETPGQTSSTNRASENKASEEGSSNGDIYKTVIKSGALGSEEDYRAALAKVTKQIQKSPEEPNRYLKRGLMYFFKAGAKSTSLDGTSSQSKEIYNKAISDFSKVIELKPDDDRPYRWRAESCIAIGKTADAIADADKLHELDPESDIPHSLKANAYVGAKQFDKAITEIDQRIKLAEKQDNKQVVAYSYHDRANIYFNKGEFDKSIEDNKRSIDRLDTSNPPGAILVSSCHANIASAYLKKQDYDNTILECKAAIDCAKGFTPPSYAYLNMGEAYSAQGKHEKAVEIYEQAIKRYSPNFKEAYLRCSKELKALGQNEKAAEYLKTYESLSQ